MRKPASTKKRQTKPCQGHVPGKGQLRIIGGQWRGRRLDFSPREGLRPTPDRVRETLFNWLAPYIEGARCLDLFSGSGALCLEALSRGAAEVVAVDSDPAVTTQIQRNIDLLGATEAATLVNGDAITFLHSPANSPVDIVFLDPPFNRDLLSDSCEGLAAGAWVKADTWVYIEHSVAETLPNLPDNWALHRQKKAGQVAYKLFRVDC